MSSYTSNSSFGSRTSSDLGPTSPQHDFAKLPTFNEEANEPLDHPVLSSFNRDTVVAGEFGLPKMQTKSAWLKQMAKFDKEDAKKAKKDARRARHQHAEPEPVKTKAQKKKEKKAKEEEADDEE